MGREDPYSYPSSSSRRDSKWDDSEDSLRPSARGQDSSSSSSRPRSRSRSGTRSTKTHKSSKSSKSSRSSKAPEVVSKPSKTPKDPRDMPRKRKSTGGETSSTTAAATSTSTEVASTKNSSSGSTFGVSPAGLLSNLSSAYSLALPDTPVTNLLNPSNLRFPNSQDVLHARLSTNLPRHGNAYVILLVGTLLTSHWLVLAALFGVVKGGLFLQSYNGRDIARDLGQLMTGFAAAAAFVALWAFSSIFSVVLTIVKVAALVCVHAAFFDIDAAPKGRPIHRVPSGPVPTTQGVLRPAGTSALTPQNAVAWAGQQIRSVSEGNLNLSAAAAQANGWFAGAGLRSSEEGGVEEIPRPWGYHENARPQSYVAGRSY
uniref:Prenylated rab acceptor 1 n=1 Tax=Colletotrichum fructicola (strain Nara gc5) TaxID=1213859 RepID=L2GHW1_COLFN